MLPADLTKPGAVAALVDDVAARGLDVDWLVNNAGFGTVGLFHTMPVERELEEITLNVEALVELTGRLLPPMVRRGRGVVMNIASVGAYLPSPHMATYTATKAFVLSFTEAIAVELAGHGRPRAVRLSGRDAHGVPGSGERGDRATCPTCSSRAPRTSPTRRCARSATAPSW